MRGWLTALLGVFVMQAANSRLAPWQPDNGDGTFHNPVIYADYSDPDVLRAGKYFYLVSSSFVSTPALRIRRIRCILLRAALLQPPRSSC